jgi:hypothetical protein
VAVRGTTQSLAPGVTRDGSGGFFRFAAFMSALAVAGGVLTFGVMHIPVKMAILPQSQRGDYSWVASGGAALVIVVTLAWVTLLRLRFLAAPDADTSATGQRPAHQAGVSDNAGTRSKVLAPLAVLRPELVRTRVIVVTALVALGMVIGSALMAWPAWAIVSAAVIPWIPVFFIEGIRKYRHYGLYAVFGAITLLQIGHLGEHSVQVGQVFMTNGDLARSHGVFGQLDFETVHFTWDSIVWLGLGVLLARFGGTNKWLWLSFAAASLHEIEHLYLFFVYRVDPAFYASGGLAGIMGRGGVVGSPLARPYLHFAYNVLVIVPLVFAFWDQTVRVYRSERVTPAHAASDPATMLTAISPSRAT